MTPAEVVRAFYRAVNARDAAALTALIDSAFAEDATLLLPSSLPYGGDVVGARRLARTFGAMAAATAPVGPARVTVVDVVDGGDRVAARLEFDWHPPGSASSVPSGALELWTFRGGLVAEIRAFYWDTAALLMASADRPTI